jgi:hypothetical protein
MAAVVGVQDHFPAIGSNTFHELTAGGSHSPQAGRKLRSLVELAQLPAKKVPDFKNGLDAMDRHL